MITHHLREFTELTRYTVIGTSGAAGTLSSLLFDARSWQVRNLVVAGRVTAHEFVQIPVERCAAIDDESRELAVDTPVVTLRASRAMPSQGLAGDDLVDAAALVGRPVDARDGRAGRIADLIVNVNVWEMRYFVIHTESGCVLTDIEWAGSFGDSETGPAIDLPVAAIVSAPAYTGLAELCSGYEEALYRHYTRRTYALGGSGA